MKMTIVGPQIKSKMNVYSDSYFNHPDEMKDMETYSDCRPTDIMGGFVPQGKSEANLKKTEEAIQERFGLEKGGNE